MIEIAAGIRSARWFRIAALWCAGEFEAKWDAEYLPIGQSQRRNWERLTSVFDFRPEIRKVIYTTNAIESVNLSVRKLIKHRGAFPKADAPVELIHLAPT